MCPTPNIGKIIQLSHEHPSLPAKLTSTTKDMDSGKRLERSPGSRRVLRWRSSRFQDLYREQRNDQRTYGEPFRSIQKKSTVCWHGLGFYVGKRHNIFDAETPAMTSGLDPQHRDSDWTGRPLSSRAPKRPCFECSRTPGPTQDMAVEIVESASLFQQRGKYNHCLLGPGVQRE